MTTKRKIFKVLSLIGILVGTAGTLISSFADDKMLDLTIDEKIDAKLAARENEEESEEP